MFVLAQGMVYCLHYIALVVVNINFIYFFGPVVCLVGLKDNFFNDTLHSFWRQLRFETRYFLEVALGMDVLTVIAHSHTDTHRRLSTFY